ncbi:MAG: HPr family phosphocarrier protein [Anaerolineaceae bacterium]|jgi:phosphotransferase system HPr (HPr) family protein|nr:HPr family phosphocarrier protein [Anaerolineaceae bacterium]
MKTNLTIEITHPAGLHARPASLFVQTASQFTSEISVQDLTTKSGSVSAKSILSILTLGVLQGHQIEIVADGDDAEESVKALKALIEDDFGEK